MFRDRSFAVKLTALITMVSGLGIALVSATLIVLEVRRVRDVAVQMVHAHARVIAANSTAALDFDDPDAARQTLHGLAAVDEFAVAEILRPDGSTFARYERGPGLPRLELDADGFMFEGRWLVFANPIVHEKQTLGRLMLLYDFGPARQRLLTDIALAVGVGLAAMILSFVVARRVQRTLLRPVNELGRAATSIASSKDYNVRAQKFSGDELGRLTDVFNDMIEQIRRSQENLRESERRFRTVADSSPILMWLNDSAGCVFVNRAYLDFLGLERQIDVTGMDWAQYVHPDDRDIYLKRYQECAAQRCTFNAEFRFRRSDGQYRWMRSVAEPQVLPTGELVGYTGCTYDVTESRQAESILRDHQAALEREVAQRTEQVIEAQRRLAVSERMASLGTLSAGLGHDIGNILMPLKSHLQRLRRLARNAEPAQDHFTAIDQAIEYLYNLSNGLRLLARDPGRVNETQEPTRIADWWKATEPLLRTVIGNRIALESDLPPDLPDIRIEKHLLTQVVFNLVQNAAQALTLETGVPRGDASIRIAARAIESHAGGPRVRVTVADNGPGMAEEVKRRCLEPYFTTKTRRISSGLGLPLVKGIIDNAGGTLEIDSVLGQGATFTIELPAGTAPAARRRSSALIILSNARSRAIIAHMLSTLNYEVWNDPASAPAGGLWVTDAPEGVPDDWSGFVVVLGPDGHGPAGQRANRIYIDPAAPPHLIRKLFQELELQPIPRESP